MPLKGVADAVDTEGTMEGVGETVGVDTTEEEASMVAQILTTIGEEGTEVVVTGSGRRRRLHTRTAPTQIRMVDLTNHRRDSRISRPSRTTIITDITTGRPRLMEDTIHMARV